MKRILIIIALILCCFSMFSRSTSSRSEIIVATTDLLDKEQLSFPYVFTDIENRNLYLQFIEKDFISISNLVTNGNEKLLFTDIYKVHHGTSKYVYEVDSLASTNRVERKESKLIAPFDYANNDSISCNSIFPILKSGTLIRIDSSFGTIAIENFSFRLNFMTKEEKSGMYVRLWNELKNK